MINYEKALNPSQLEAATFTDDSALVIAGAGSGKTRVIVYRLAWLAEQGIDPASILLLTFTRKAAAEMLNRAALLIAQGLTGIVGGTFHAFAYSVLRRYPPEWVNGRSFTLLDSADIIHAVRQCRDALKIGKRDSSFPKTQTIAGIISKAKNKEITIEEVLRRDSFHLLPHAQAIEDISAAYDAFRKEKALLDYDDLLVELENLLMQDSFVAMKIREHIKHVLVDEYQDTNLIQARITRLLAVDSQTSSPTAQVMAVGDDAQSIYAFRGANVRNILDFPRLFPNTKIIRLEENYRSTQPILDVANSILANAQESFHKNLFTSKKGGEPVKVIAPLSDATQAQLVVKRIQELLSSHLPHEIAVLFRAGYHSYPLESALRLAKIPFRKYGGLRLIEAAHIKDIISFARLSLNPLDLPAFSRVASMHKGVGPKTIASLHSMLSNNNVAGLRKTLAKKPELLNDLVFVDELRLQNLSPGDFFERLITWYKPRLELTYPDDWPSRMQGLEELLQIANSYEELDLFIADLALESPEEKNDDREHCITLSTVHSAKGLEWNAVLIIDAVEDRFPSRHASVRPEDFEEERRLFYVACTRAKNLLELYAPATMYSRQENTHIRVSPSPFIQEIDPACVQNWSETYDGKLVLKSSNAPKKNKPIFRTAQTDVSKKSVISKLGYCHHRIFGRGKIVKQIDNEKVQVNFPGFGLKIILSDYLKLEE